MLLRLLCTITLLLNGFSGGCGGSSSDRQIKETYVRAEVLIQALDANMTKHGIYPHTLDALIPELLDEIPKPAMGAGEWTYELENGGEAFVLGFRGPRQEDPEHYFVSSLGEWVVDTK